MILTSAHCILLVVIPTERDDLEQGSFQNMHTIIGSPDRPSTIEASSHTGGRPRASTLDSFNSLRSQNSQNGALFRRVVGTNAVPAPPIPPPSNINGVANNSSTYRSVSGGSNVSFQHPLADMIPDSSRGNDGEKSK
jgi:hypothetical protein